MAGPRTDATTVAIPTTLLPAAPRKARQSPAHATITLVGARASTPPPSTSPSPREDSIRRHSRRSTFRRKRSRRLRGGSDDGVSSYDSNDVVSTSSDKDTERLVEDKLDGLCFITDIVGGLCTMALGEDTVGTSDDKDIDDDTTSLVLPSANDLAVKIEELNTALASQDKLLR
jgi:hypothetical protein